LLFLLIHFLFSHSFDDHQRSFTAARAAEPRLTFGARQQPTYRNNINNNKPDLTNFLDHLHQLEAENNTSANNSKFFGKEKNFKSEAPHPPSAPPPQQPIGSLYSLTTFVFISKTLSFRRYFVVVSIDHVSGVQERAFLSHALLRFFRVKPFSEI
jgi:hypothetical protein